MPKIVRVTVEMEDNEAWELAQFVKRSTWEHFRSCSVDDDEACQIRDAVAKLELALRQAGYSPR